MRDESSLFDVKMLHLEQYEKYFSSHKTDDKEVETPYSERAQHLKKLQAAKHEFLRCQGRSKLIQINPIFNQKEYLGINTVPLPEERYLLELCFPQVQVAFKDSSSNLKQLTEIDIDYLIKTEF